MEAGRPRIITRLFTAQGHLAKGASSKRNIIHIPLWCPAWGCIIPDGHLCYLIRRKGLRESAEALERSYKSIAVIISTNRIIMILG